MKEFFRTIKRNPGIIMATIAWYLYVFLPIMEFARSALITCDPSFIGSEGVERCLLIANTVRAALPVFLVLFFVGYILNAILKVFKEEAKFDVNKEFKRICFFQLGIYIILILPISIIDTIQALTNTLATPDVGYILRAEAFGFITELVFINLPLIIMDYLSIAFIKRGLNMKFRKR